jgi:hypothetical protein
MSTDTTRYAHACTSEVYCRGVIVIPYQGSACNCARCSYIVQARTQLTTQSLRHGLTSGLSCTAGTQVAAAVRTDHISAHLLSVRLGGKAGTAAAAAAGGEKEGAEADDVVRVSALGCGAAWHAH